MLRRVYADNPRKFSYQCTIYFMHGCFQTSSKQYCTVGVCTVVSKLIHCCIFRSLSPCKYARFVGSCFVGTFVGCSFSFRNIVSIFLELRFNSVLVKLYVGAYHENNSKGARACLQYFFVPLDVNYFRCRDYERWAVYENLLLCGKSLLKLCTLVETFLLNIRSIFRVSLDFFILAVHKGWAVVRS